MEVSMVRLEDARRVIAAAERKAGELGQPMNIAVVDAGGNLVSHVRMDGAWLGSIDISIKKAFTSRAFDITTKDLATHSQSGGQFFGIHASNDGRVDDLRGRRAAEARQRRRRRRGRERRQRRPGSRGRRGRRRGVLIPCNAKRAAVERAGLASAPPFEIQAIGLSRCAPP